MPINYSVLPKRSPYTQEQIIKAAATYVATGNSKETSRITKVPDATIRSWRNTEWWPILVADIRADGCDELDARLSAIRDAALLEVRDRLEKGDIHITKEGKKVRKGMDGRHAMGIAVAAQDKINVLRGGETGSSVTDKEISSKLDKLFESFEKMNRRLDEKTIEGEVVNGNEVSSGNS